jgi:hypothetical protein
VDDLCAVLRFVGLGDFAGETHKTNKPTLDGRELFCGILGSHSKSGKDLTLEITRIFSPLDIDATPTELTPNI